MHVARESNLKLVVVGTATSAAAAVPEVDDAADAKATVAACDREVHFVQQGTTQGGSSDSKNCLLTRVSHVKLGSQAETLADDTANHMFRRRRDGQRVELLFTAHHDDVGPVHDVDVEERLEAWAVEPNRDSVQECVIR